MKWDSLRFIYYYILFIILLYNYIIILLLYSFINCNDRYDNENSRSIIGQINPVSETFLQCIMIISRIKQYFFIWIVYYFRLKKLLRQGWKDDQKTIKALNWFHVLNMFKKCSHLKMFHSCFSTCIKAARFVVPLIVLRKVMVFKIFAGLQVHLKTNLRHTNKSTQ